MASKGCKSWSPTASDNVLGNTGVSMSGSDQVSTIDNSVRQIMADIAAELALRSGAVTTGGSADAQTYSTTSAGYATAWTAYEVGDFITFTAGYTNTGSATLNVDGLGAKAIKKHHDVDLGAGDIEAGGIYTVAYDGANFQLLTPLATTISPTAAGLALLDDADAAAQRATLGLVIGTDVQAYDADTLKADVGDTLTAGYLSDSYAGGTVSSGTYTPAPATGQENFQHYTNGGAHTLAPPASPCSVVVQITNNASAGAITTSGFTKVVGDSFTTTNGDKFMCFIVKTNDYSLLNVVALQ